MKPMEHLLHLDRTLDELDPPPWATPAADATHLARRVRKLRCVPLSRTPSGGSAHAHLAAGGPAVCPSTRSALADRAAAAGRVLLRGGPAARGRRRPASAWAVLPDLRARLHTVITNLPEAAVTELPRGAAEQLARFVARTGPHCRPREEAGQGIQEKRPDDLSQGFGGQEPPRPTPGPSPRGVSQAGALGLLELQ